MEDGAKEDPAQHNEPKFLSKAGWLKKAPGRLLASYKDRYIHVEKTEIVVYENEELQNCLERLDLENYDKCHELKSPFTKKQRLILIRSPKSGNKVHDVKFQAQTAEEKEAWIKALSDGINRAKNKVFDEVKVDQGSNLEHVTRSRPKGNRNRRPPTRIHMKEVALVSSDGILRLDLDIEDAIMPNGAHYVNVDGSDTLKVPPSNTGEKPLVPITEEEAQPDPEVSQQKKVIKPPMPPTKEAKPSAALEDEAHKNDGSEKKAPKPPASTLNEAKPCASPAEETTDETKPEKLSEMSSDASKKAAPPPMPPNKPSTCSWTSNLADASQSKPHPPTPPSKEKKPSHPTVEPGRQVEGLSNEDNENEDSSVNKTSETTMEIDETVQLISTEALPCVRDDSTEETVNSNKKVMSDSGPQTPTESPRKSPSPLAKFKKKPDGLAESDIQHTESHSAMSHPKEGADYTTSTSSVQSEDALPKSEDPSVIVSMNDSATDNLTSGPLLHQLSGEKKKKDEKSVDSGQHSDDESDASGSQDTLVASNGVPRGSRDALDVLDTSDIQSSVISKPAQVKPKVFHRVKVEPTIPLKPTTKVRSASTADLLSDSDADIQLKESGRPGAGSAGSPNDDVLNLETEVALEMEKTSKLLSKVSQDQGGSVEEGVPRDLLAEAMEKLKKAEHVLREVKKLKLTKNVRKSW
ncbi:104 kDa microneme/rhoptry antigen [Archocentrus centrarchus]|uniref:104 kDa microneme/rhoptry antigen n=1 Tax=Archocentrus centrarchus TaxID=63155 RepID=UPI0011E9CD7D|nr:pleckstrin homology domain-containing family O member 2 [Archocentrus centrarchus]